MLRSQLAIAALFVTTLSGLHAFATQTCGVTTDKPVTKLHGVLHLKSKRLGLTINDQPNALWPADFGRRLELGVFERKPGVGELTFEPRLHGPGGSKIPNGILVRGISLYSTSGPRSLIIQGHSEFGEITATNMNWKLGNNISKDSQWASDSAVMISLQNSALLQCLVTKVKLGNATLAVQNN